MGMTDQEMRAASGALITEAGKWEDEAPNLTSIQTALQGMTLTRVEAGLFQIMFDSYEQCRSNVEARAGEGSTEFKKMGETLREISKDYAATDEAEANEYASRRW